MQIWNRLLIVIIILCVNFISFCACFCILFVLILFIFCVKNYDSFMLIFFHLYFSNNIFNFTDILFYYVLANRQFRYPTSLHSVTRGAGTAYISGAPEFTVGFKMCSRYSIFSFMCMFCRSLFVLLPCFVWPFYCLSSDLRILTTPMVSPNSSCNYRHDHSSINIYSNCWEFMLPL